MMLILLVIVAFTLLIGFSLAVSQLSWPEERKRKQEIQMCAKCDSSAHLTRTSADWHGLYFVVCDDMWYCSCPGPDLPFFLRKDPSIEPNRGPKRLTERSAIQAWNRRQEKESKRRLRGEGE